MMSNAPQSAALPPSNGQDRGIAAVALLGVCIFVAFLLVFGFGGDRVRPAGGGLVTVQALDGDPAGRSADDSALIGSNVRRTQAGRQLAEGLSLSPKQVQGQTIGYVVGEASTAPALAAARLRVGDMLTSIDDRPLDGARVRALAEELSTYDRVEIQFERNGRFRRRTLDFLRYQ